MDQVDQVKQKIDIVAVVGEHIQLSKAGRNYKALCPFHQENTPSFIVSPELQIYKCFSCGESGDVISFVEKYEGLEFFDALKLLAAKAGVKLQTPQGEKYSEKERLYEANDLAAKFYNYLLLNHKLGAEGLDYLTNVRGISIETIKNFSLGVAPDIADTLSSFLLTKKKFKITELERSGLVIVSRGRNFDRFRGRIIFPLYDHRNVCVGLAGRILPSVEEKLKDRHLGKYVNSPETPIYHKSNMLYGLNVTKNDIKKAKEALIVEGEVDFLSLYQAGIKNVVAIKGTALTEEQIKILSRFTDTLILALDSDIAGDGASRRGITIAQNLGMKVKVLQPSAKYKDPDEFVRQDLAGFKEQIVEAENVWDFIINSIFSKNDPTTGDGKSSISRELVPILAAIDDKIVQSHYVSRVAKKLDVDTTAVWKQIEKVQPNTESTQEKQQTKVNDYAFDKKQTAKISGRQQILEEKLISLAFSSTPEVLKMHQDIFQTLFAKKIAETFVGFVTDNKFSLAEFVKFLPLEFSEKFSDLVLNANKEFEDDQSQIKEELDLVVKELGNLNYKTRLTALTKEISQAEDKGDQLQLEQLTKEFTRISKLLSQIDSKS